MKIVSQTASVFVGGQQSKKIDTRATLRMDYGTKLAQFCIMTAESRLVNGTKTKYKVLDLQP